MISIYTFPISHVPESIGYISCCFCIIQLNGCAHLKRHGVPKYRVSLANIPKIDSFCIKVFCLYFPH